MSAREDSKERGGRLDGWKEIASYVGVGVRHAMRYADRDERPMPVMKKGTSTTSRVFALKKRIDEWLDAEHEEAVPRGSQQVAAG